MMTDTNQFDIYAEYEKMCRSFRILSNKCQHAERQNEIKDRKIGELNRKMVEKDRNTKLSEDAYKREIKAKDNEIEQLTKLVSDLEGEIKKLKAQINRDYTTSSIPSSMKPNHRKIQNSREKSIRKQGGQPGHAHHPRKEIESTAAPVILDKPAEVIEKPNDYVFVRNVSKKTVDIRILVDVQEYIGSEYRKIGTSRTVRSVFPAGVKDEMNYGPGVKAFCALLNNYCNVSIRKTQEVLAGLTNGSAVLSVGKINGLSKEFSDNTKEEKNEIFNRLFVSTYQNTDATYIRINGKIWYVYTSTNKSGTLYSLKEHKGDEGIKGTPVDGYNGVLITDHDKTYFKYGEGHQKCLAHELRYIKDSIVNEPNLTWNVQMEELIKKIIHEFKNGKRDFSEELQKYDRIIETGEKEYKDHPPTRYYRDGFNTFKRMRDYKEYIFYFLDHPEVPYTNNDAERMLREIKRKSKQVGAFRSAKTTEYYCDMMTIIETAITNGENVYDTILKYY